MLSSKIGNTITKTPIETNDQTQKKTKKAFTHGNNVIIKRGTYKGYYAFVYEFHPAKLQVEIEEEHYVSDLPEYGQDYKVIKEIPQLYGINVNINGKMQEIRMTTNTLMTVVAVEINGSLQLANLVNKNTTDCELRIIDLDEDLVTKINNMSIQDTKEETENQKIRKLLDMLGEAIRKESLEGKEIIQCDRSLIRSPEYYFVLYKSGNENDPMYQGLYGTLTRIISPQYLVQHKKNILFAKSDIQETGNNTIKIKNKSYKGMSGKIVARHPPTLTLYIDSLGKKVNSHVVQENGVYLQRAITPNDVFYIDILLKNGNIFEVKQITDDKIIGIERSNNTTFPKEISIGEVEAFQPGFSFSSKIIDNIDTKGDNDSDDDGGIETENPSYNDSETEGGNEDDSDNDGEFDGDLEDETELSEGEDPFTVLYDVEPIIDTEGDMKASYKDYERSGIMNVQLSKKQQEIKNKINNILNLYGVDGEVPLYEIIPRVEETITLIQKSLQDADMSFWNPSDEKYIIAALVLHEIVKKGFGSTIAPPKQDIITKFIDDLSNKKKIFHKKDTVESIWLMNDWSSHVKVQNDILETMQKSKEYDQLFKVMFNNAFALVSSYLGPVNLSSRFIVSEEDLIPLSGKKVEVVKVIYPKDLISNNIPKTATKIFWGPRFDNILQEYKKAIVSKINSSNNNANRIVYEYVLENLERAPFALEELKNSILSTKLKIEHLKFTTLKSVYDQLLDKVQRLLVLQDKQKSEQQQITSQKKSALDKRRRAIYQANNLASDFIDLDINEKSETSLKKRKV